MAGSVVVVGAGNAGLTAALAAREAGAHVTVLEAAPQAERGGNTRFTGGLFRVSHSGIADLLGLVGEDGAPEGLELTTEPYPSQRFVADLMAASGGRADPALTELLATQSRSGVEWLRDEHGVLFEFIAGKLLDTSVSESATYVLPAGGAVRARGEGPGLSASLFAAAERAGVEIVYDAPVADLIVYGSTVSGVRVRERSRFRDVPGAVILACGGFEANPALRSRYLGPGWDLVKVRGSRFNTGVMLEQALSHGAAPAGHWAGCHASPVDADAPEIGDISLTDQLSRYSYLYGVMVNSRGERFLDEGADEVWRTYARVGAAIREQPGSVAYQIFDQRTVRLLEPRYATATAIRAGSVPKLAEALGVPEPNLHKTLADYNAATRSGEFDPFRTDGLATDGSLRPPKSNWAQPLDRPPYTAFAVTCGITFTYGGLTTDEHAQVHDGLGRPMPGLYAVGEISGGGFYFNYPGGSGLTRGLVFGRTAGRNAATGRTLTPALAGTAAARSRRRIVGDGVAGADPGMLAAASTSTGPDRSA